MIKIGIKNCLRYMSSLLVPTGDQAHLTEEKFQVKFENEQSRDAIISRYADYDFTRIVPIAGDEALENRHKESGLLLCSIASAKKTRSASIREKELQSESGIRSISPITYTIIEKPDNVESSVRSEEVFSYTCSSATTFSDPLYNKQWHYSDPSYVNIDLEKAWALETGKPNVIVAVMDGFIDYTHPDLIANLWVNEAELNGLPGVDDDGNGYVDDIHGLNLLPEQLFSDHATHIAGTIAASIAHDSHNIVAVGDNDEDIVKIINTLIEAKGGVGVIENGEIELLSLPIAGLMTDKSAEEVVNQYAVLDAKAKRLGCALRSSFITMAFMALPVIPELKITDKGLVDINVFDFTTVEVD